MFSEAELIEIEKRAEALMAASREPKRDAQPVKTDYFYCMAGVNREQLGAMVYDDIRRLVGSVRRRQPGAVARAAGQP